MKATFEYIEELIEMSIIGETFAIEELYSITYPHLYKVALHLIKDVHEAEDMVQEAFSIIFINLNRIPNTKYFIPWCKRITTNYCLRYMESPHDLPLDNIDLYLSNKESAHKDPLISVLDTERKTLFFAKIDTVDPLLSTTLELRYYHNYKMSEIALIMDCPEGTVKSRLNRAKKVAREVLGDDKNLSLGWGMLLPAGLLIPKTSVKASSLSTPVIFTTVGVTALISSSVVSSGIEYYADSQPALVTNPSGTITQLDTSFPTLLGYEIADGLLVIRMEDNESGIDYNNVYGVTNSDSIIKTLKIDTKEGILYFEIPDENFILYVSDNAGNISHTQLRFTN